MQPTAPLDAESVMEYVEIDGVPEPAAVRAVVYCWDSVDGMKPIWNTPLVSKNK